MKSKLLIIVFCCVVMPTHAFTSVLQEQNRQQNSATTQISKEQAARLAQERYPGRILKVHSEQRYHHVRVMQQDGRVVNIIVDSRSGRVKREE